MSARSPLDGMIQAKLDADSLSGAGRTFTSFESNNSHSVGLAAPKHGIIYQVVTFPFTVLVWYIKTLLAIPSYIQNVFENIFFEVQTKLIPFLSEFWAWPFNTAIPFLLSSKFPTYFVPYAIWKGFINLFGSEQQMLTGETGNELERVTEKLAQVSVEKNALLDVSIQNRKLQQENDDLKQKIKDLEAAK